MFVVFDDMQYTKRDCRNRNLIKTPNGLKWLTIPVEVKGKYHQKIKDTKVADKNWVKSHLNALEINYKNAKCFNEIWDWVQELYLNCKFQFLTDINMYFIQAINEFLEIKTEILFSDNFNLHDDRNMRLINICKELSGNTYLSGPSAKQYLDEQLFNKSGINVKYLNYSNYPEYNQLYNDFEHGVSILDLIFNMGDQSKLYIS